MFVHTMLSLGDKYLDYTVKAFIGRGGMGTVFLLEKKNGEKAALKILHPHLMDDEELVHRFYLEAEVAGRINSPKVCKVFDVRKVSLGEKESHGILMEYVEGDSLADMMEDCEVFGEDWALHVADNVLEALEAVHGAGLLHRDIKPENILITPDDSIKLLDLGLAKVMESSIKLSKTGYFIGTYQYASPEQLTGDPLDPSCDIYSLGTVLYELTTGTRPYKSNDLRELMHEKVNVPARPPGRINPTLTPFFDMLILEMMAINPEKRLRSATRVRELIKQREKSDWYRAKVSLSMSLESLSKQSTLRRMVRVPRRTALHGRNKELKKLLEWADQALGFVKPDDESKSEPEKGFGVMIGGEAGIGKTRLVEEIVIRLEAREKEHVALVGRSQQERRHVPYSPLIDMVRDFFLLDDEPEVDLVQLFSEYLPNLRPLIPPFLELVTRRSYLDESTIRGVLNESNLLHLFQTLFSTIAKEIPLILFFDDLQWADVNTINVLSYLVAGLGDAPLLILGTFRDEELQSEETETHPLVEFLAKFARTRQVNRISLERLDEDACIDIIEECFPNAPFVDSLGERVYKKSEGNPFFIMEILNLLYDEGRVGFVDGRWTMKGETEDIEIPASLRDIVAFRLERLADEERDVIEAASILGYRFESKLLGDLIELSRIKLLKILQKL
ncbi:MAG: protein kinase, partial [bacterium]|nr:protein kinase [bacterium]